MSAGVEKTVSDVGKAGGAYEGTKLIAFFHGYQHTGRRGGFHDAVMRFNSVCGIRDRYAAVRRVPTNSPQEKPSVRGHYIVPIRVEIHSTL